MTNLKRRVASHKIQRFLQNNKVTFFFQKKSMQSDHWRLLKKKIANIQGVASLNIKNRRDRREIQSLILSRFAAQEGVTTLLNSSPLSFPPLHANHRDHINSSNVLRENLHISGETNPVSSSFQGKNEVLFFSEEKKTRQPHIGKKSGLEIAEHLCNLLYTPNLILGSDSLEKMARLSHELNLDSNLIFMGGWDRDHLINHLDSLKLQEIPRDIWKEGLSFFSLSYGRPCFFLASLLERNKRNFLFLLKEYKEQLATRLKEENGVLSKEKTQGSKIEI